MKTDVVRKSIFIDSFRVASGLASVSYGMPTDKSAPDHTQKCQRLAVIGNSKWRRNVSISLLASKVMFKSSKAPIGITCYWFCQSLRGSWFQSFKKLSCKKTMFCFALRDFIHTHSGYFYIIFLYIY